MAQLLREFYELCEGGVCQDLLTEAEKRFVKEGGMMLTGKLQEADVQNVSHMVTEVWMDGPSVMGKIKVLGTPSGQILKALVESGVKTGISSRGMGSVTERQGKTMVEDDFQLICFDIVSEPSTPNAFMALSENKLRNEQAVKNNKVLSLIDSILED